LWVEDDACKTANDTSREMLEGAWHRIFGTTLPSNSEALDKEDLGECVMYLHADGIIVTSGFWGDQIEQIDADGIGEDRFHLDDVKVPSNTDQDNPFEDDEDEGEENERVRWSPDQIVAIESVIDELKSGKRVMVLKGPAGTGKTTVAQEIAPRAASLGWAIKYLAPTGKAAVNISDVVGSPARTIHSALFKTVTVGKNGQPIFLNPKDLAVGKVLFFIDEGYMVGKRLYDKIIKHLGPLGVVVFMGDDKQLGPVADRPGPDFDSPTAELFKVHRQGLGDPILDVATMVRQGQPLPKEDIMGLEGKSYTRRGGSLTYVSQWMIEHIHAKNDAIVICYSNKTRKQINVLVRHQLGYRERGAILDGERMIFLKNNSKLGRMNGETFVVEKVTPFPVPGARKDHGIVVVTTSEGEFVTKVSLIGESTTEVEKASKKYEKHISPDLWIPVDYAYAITCHKSQGSQYDHVCFVIESTFRWMIQTKKMSYEDACRLCYTAVTRGKRNLLVFDARRS